MGAERVLQAARFLRRARYAATVAIAVGAAGSAHADAGKTRERSAVIDLGPADDGAIRRRLASAVVTGGLEPVLGGGIEDALAGQAGAKDDTALAATLAEAQRAFTAAATAAMSGTMT